MQSLVCEKWFVHFSFALLAARLKYRSSVVIGQFDRSAVLRCFVLSIHNCNEMFFACRHRNVCSLFMFSQCISITNVNTWSSLWKCYGIVFLVSWMKDIVIKINVRIPIVSVVSFVVWWLIPSRSIYGAEFVKLFFSSTFPYHNHNKPNANKKKPLFSFRLKLINPMTRAKVSNQGGTVNWCISLSDCSCNKRVQSQKVQRQNCLHLSSSVRPWNYLLQSNFLAIKIFFSILSFTW